MGPWRGALSVASMNFEITSLLCRVWLKREGCWWKAVLGAVFLGRRRISKNLTSCWASGLASCARAVAGVSGSGQRGWLRALWPVQRRKCTGNHCGVLTTVSASEAGEPGSDSDCPLYCIFCISELGRFHLSSGTNGMRLVRVQWDTARDSLLRRLAPLRHLIHECDWHPASSFILSRGPEGWTEGKDHAPLVRSSKDGTSKRGEEPLWLVLWETIQLSLELKAHWLIVSKPRNGRGGI